MYRPLVALVVFILVSCGSLPARTAASQDPEPNATTAAPAPTASPDIALPVPSAAPAPTPRAAPTVPPTPTPDPQLIASVDRRFDTIELPPLAWSPDGRSLLLGGAGTQLIRYPLDGGAPLVVLDDLKPGIHFAQVRPVWDHANDVIVSPRWETHESFAIVALDPDGGERRRLLAGVAVDSWWGSMRPHLLEEANALPLSVFDVAIAADGGAGRLTDDQVLRMRVGRPDEQVALPAGVREALLAAGPAAHHSLWLAPGGGQIAVTVEGQVFLFGPAPTDPLVQVMLPGGDSRPVLPLELAWSPDGRSLAIIAADVSRDIGNFVRMSFLVDTTTGALTRVGDVLPDGTEQLPYIPGNSRTIRTVAWSPDGRWLLLGRPTEEQCGSDYARCNASQTLLEPATGTVQMLWLAPGGSNAAWSPDGARIAVMCADASSHLCVLTLNEGWEVALR